MNSISSARTGFSIATIVGRLGAALSLLGQGVNVVLSIVRIRDFTDRSEVRGNRVYSTTEAARFLATDRIGVIRLIRSGELPARKAAGNYRIAGHNVIRYLGGSNATSEDAPEAEPAVARRRGHSRSSGKGKGKGN